MSRSYGSLNSGPSAEKMAEEGIKQAQNLYSKSKWKKESLDPTTEEQIKTTVRKLLKDNLPSYNKRNRFKYDEFWSVIQKTAAAEMFIPEKAAEAFKLLEIYIILLFSTPWKREFRRLKTYCGFFQARIRSHLQEPESIICLVGFHQESDGVLSLPGELDQELLLMVAFNCVVATVECEILSEMHRKVKEIGMTFADVVRWRETGQMPEVKRVFSDNIGSQESNQSPHIDHYSGSKGSSNDTVGYGKGSNSNVSGIHVGTKSRSMTPGAEGGVHGNLPYIDDDTRNVNDTGYTEGTIDEHYSASLQLLDRSKSSLREQPTAPRPSEDWAYVRDGLANKYGPQYYHGQRGDVIRNQVVTVRQRNVDDMSDEGIDVEEGPPPVNIHNPPVQITARDSGYRTGPPTQVYYPPTMSSQSHSRYNPVSPGMTSVTSAYVSQNPTRSAMPILARGVKDASYTTDGARVRESVYSTDSSQARDTGYNTNSSRIQAQPPHYKTNTSFSTGAPVVKSITKSSEWQCPACTFCNKGTDICDVCGKSRDSPEMDGPQCGESVTVCRKCTVENTPGSDVCTVCGHALERGSLHTFV